MTRIGSLFSGAGGLDMAVEQVFGGEVVWHCENDPAAAKVLAHHWPGVPNHSDITQVDWTQVELVDVLCGGWPCQPFSLAGKRKGADDERALWPYVARAVRMVRPRIIVLENVSAVLGPEFARVANDLAALGYDLRWTCLRASDVGAPHRRERVFIIAHAAGVGRRGWGQETEPRGDRRSQSPDPTDRPATAAHADAACDGRHEGRSEPERFVGGSDAAERGDGPVDLLPTPNASDTSKHAGQPLHKRFGHALRLTDVVEHGLLPTPTSRDHKGRNQRGDDTCLSGALLPTPNAADGVRGQDFARANRDGSGGDDLVTLAVKATRASQWGKYEQAINRWGELTRAAPSPTEPNKNGNPRLSAAFSEWMMGWPAGHVTTVDGVSRNDQLRIIGNGVVPQQAVAALRWLLSVAEVAA